MRLLRLTSIVLLCVALVSCGGPSKEIAGKWKTTGTTESVWEFFANGSLSVDGAAGRYTFGDNKRIKVQTSAATFVYQFDIHGDRMTWTALDGTKMEFVRAK